MASTVLGASERLVGDVAHRQRDRPEDLGFGAELAERHRVVAGCGRDPPVERVGDAVEQRPAGRRELAADDHELGVEHPAHAREDAADRLAGVSDQSCGARIPIVGQRDQLIHGDVRAVDLPQRGGQRRSARDGGQAAPVAATAYLSFGVDDDVPELAGRARVAQIDLAVDDHAAADPLRQHHVEHVPLAAPGAERRLGERAEVGVVTEVDGTPDGRRAISATLISAQPGKITPEANPGRVRADRRRHRDPGAEHALRLERRPRCEQPDTIASAIASASSASWATSSRSLRASTSSSPARLAIATRTISRPKSIPTKPPDEGSRLNRVAGRPPLGDGA